MPFRIAVALGLAVAAAIAAVVYPFLGLLVLVFLYFARPQDDRPNIAEMRIPLMMMVAVMLGMALRLGEHLPNIIAAFKRLKLTLILAGLVTLSVIVHHTRQAESGLFDFLPMVLFCVLTISLVTTEKRLQLYMFMLMASGAWIMKDVIRNPRHILTSGGSGQEIARLLMTSNLNFGNSNYLALFMVMLSFIALSLLAYYKKWYQRAGLLVFVGAAAYCFFKANSRGATLSLAVGTLVLWATSKNKIKTLVAGVVLFAAFVGAAPDSYFDRLSTVTTYTEDRSATDRIVLWRTAIDLIIANPVFGVGFQNFTLYAFNSQHQAYLQIASEAGIVALFVYIAILSSAIYAAASTRSRMRANGGYLYALSQGLLCSLIALVVMGFTTGLAHREVVHVFVSLAYIVRAFAEVAPVTQMEAALNDEQESADAFISQEQPEPSS